MIYRAAFGALIVLIILIVANEVAFNGRLFDSQPVGTVGGLGVLAAAIGARVMRQYRGQGSRALAYVAIWMAIVTALAFGYWLFGEP